MQKRCRRRRPCSGAQPGAPCPIPALRAAGSEPRRSSVPWRRWGSPGDAPKQGQAAPAPTPHCCSTTTDSSCAARAMVPPARAALRSATTRPKRAKHCNVRKVRTTAPGRQQSRASELSPCLRSAPCYHLSFCKPCSLFICNTS